MATSLVITVKAENADISQVVRDGSSDTEGVLALSDYFKKCAIGAEGAEIGVQHDEAAGPVAASGTITVTYASVADADTAVIGGLTFTAKTAVQEIQTLTFDTQENTVAGDYFVVYDDAGLAWAFAADTTGTDEEPTGAIWTAIPAGRKAQVDISAATTAAEVAAAFELVMDALSGFSSEFTTDDSAADGTMIVTAATAKLLTSGVVKNEDDSGAGSIAIAVTTAGLAKSDLSAVQFLKETDATTTAQNLADKINDHSALGKVLSAEEASGVITLTCKQKGLVGNYITLAESGNGLAVSAGALAGGTGGASSTEIVYNLGYT